MNIQLIRIDDRLIHGQVVVGWVKALSIERLVVVNEEIAKNNMRRTLMEMAVPAGLKVNFYTVDEAVEAVKETSVDRTLLLFANPMDLEAFAEKGGPVTSVNVGGMHYGDGKTQMSKTICVNSDDMKAFRALRNRGVELESRAVPSDTKEPLEAVLPEIKN